MGEEILDHCLGYETPYQETAEWIRLFVCSNHTQNNHGLIEETLRSYWLNLSEANNFGFSGGLADLVLTEQTQSVI